MAKRENDGGATVAVAEAVGRALGMVAGTADALKAQHPHPVDEAMAALAAGQVRLAEATEAAGDQAASALTSAKTVVARTRKAATKARASAAKTQRRGTKVMARAKKTTKKVVKRARKTARAAVKQAKKTTRRAVKGAKKVMRRTSKAAARGAARIRR
jgi:hypothetical protein